MEILIGIIAFIVGLVAGIFGARFIIKREFEKNPPIGEDMIAAMLKGMGQAPTKKRVNQIMKQMKATTKK